MKYLVIATALLTSTSAQAADIAQQKYDWSGAYAGLLLGASKHGNSNTGGETDEHINGKNIPTFGGYVGYNYVIDRFIVGGEVEVGLDKQNHHYVGRIYNEYNFDADIIYGVTSISRKYASAKLRAGISHDKFLLYLLGGPALKIESNNVGGDNDKKDGWVYGGGIEVGLNQHLISRIEYKHFNMGKKSIWEDARVDYNFNILNLGLAYKF